MPGFSYFGSLTLPSLDAACEDIASSDVVLLVVGHLYGMMAPGLNRSQEEREYEEARKLGKTILVFIRDEDAARVPGSIEKDSVKAPLLADFRKRLIDSHPVKIFKDIAEITGLIEDEVLKICEARNMRRRPSSKSNVRSRVMAAELDKAFSSGDANAALLPGESATKTLPVLQKALSTPFSPSKQAGNKKWVGSLIAIAVIAGAVFLVWKGDLLQKLKAQSESTVPAATLAPLDTVTIDSAIVVDTLASVADDPPQIEPSIDPLTVLFEKAKEGDSSSLFRLGVMYDSGQTLPKDDSMATTYYRKAASKGMPEAQYRMAIRHLEGNGAKRSKSLAVYWLVEAAKKGYAPAESKLGLMYMQGRGVAKDQVEGVKWLLRAADQNDEQAQKALESIKSR